MGETDSPAWAMGALSVLLIGSAGWVMATRRRRLA
jgi:LPXTG-motif cell wall-anchored protein